jgi:hypothetical protein
MSQRLQDAMLEISSSQKQQQQQQQIVPKYPTRSLPEHSAGTSRAETACTDQPQDLTVSRSSAVQSEDIAGTLPLISSHTLCKQQQQQQQQQQSQKLHSPHPLMPFLLEKVRAAACIQSELPETKEQQHHRVKPKERFKGPFAQPAAHCSSHPRFFIIHEKACNPSHAGAINAVIGSLRTQQPRDHSPLPSLAAAPSPPPNHSSTSHRRPTPRACRLARDPESDFLFEAEADSSSDRRRKSDPGPPPNRRLMCVKRMFQSKWWCPDPHVLHRYDKPWRFMARVSVGAGAAAVSPLRRAASGGLSAPSSVKTRQLSSPSPSPSASPSAASPTSSSFSSLPAAAASSPSPCSLGAADITTTGSKVISSPIWGHGVFTGMHQLCIGHISAASSLPAFTSTTSFIITDLSYQVHALGFSGQLRNGVAHGRGSWKVPPLEASLSPT